MYQFIKGIKETYPVAKLIRKFLLYILSYKLIFKWRKNKKCSYRTRNYSYVRSCILDFDTIKHLIKLGCLRTILL